MATTRPTAVRAKGPAATLRAVATEGEADVAEPVVNLGARLREVRLRSGQSLREISRQLGVSPSFVSQLENGKSQPSVATLYSLAQLLDVSIDELFAAGGAPAGEGGAEPEPAVAPSARSKGGAQAAADVVSRSDFSSPIDGFPRTSGQARVSVSRPNERPRLVMDSGVIWERLADNTGNDLDFIEIIYPARSSSTTDDRMLQHAGAEFGYLLEGELEVTVGFDTFTLRPGEALGFDSSQPHLFRNLRDTPARGIWCVRHPHA